MTAFRLHSEGKFRYVTHYGHSLNCCVILWVGGSSVKNVTSYRIYDPGLNVDKFGDIWHYRFYTGSGTESALKVVQFAVGSRTGIWCRHPRSHPKQSFKKRDTLPPRVHMLKCPGAEVGGCGGLASNVLMENTLLRNIDRTVTVFDLIPIKHALNLNTSLQNMRFFHKKCYNCRLQECEAVLFDMQRITWPSTRVNRSYWRTVHNPYRGADKSLAWPTSLCILFDGENISFDASLVIYIYIYLYIYK